MNEVLRLLGSKWLAAAVLGAAFAGTAAADIVIGQVAPLSGVLATTGAQMVLGGRICFSHVNDKGGIHGQKIKVLVADDGYKVDETVRLTKEMLGGSTGKLLK